jgi:alkylhydroperoxidase family enzyme
MPRVSEIEDDGGEPKLAEMFKADRARFGDLLNPTKVMAHCPPILEAARAMGAAIARSGQLPKGLAELVSLRVATINGCPF